MKVLNNIIVLLTLRGKPDGKHFQRPHIYGSGFRIIMKGTQEVTFKLIIAYTNIMVVLRLSYQHSSL